MIPQRVRSLAHHTALALPGMGEAITVNDDYTDSLSDVAYLCRTRRPLLVDAQESKRTDYRTRLDDRWGVRQRMTDDSTAGVAVIWDRHHADAIGAARDRPLQIGFGYVPLVVPRRGEDMLTRGIVWQDLEVIETGFHFRSGSTHRPPRRHSHLWPAFDDQYEEWLDASPLPVLVGMDGNEPGGPNVSARWRGIGIDGFSGDLTVASVLELPRRNSDHLAISGAVRFRSRRRP